MSSGRGTREARARSLSAVSRRGPRVRLVAALVLVAGVPTTAAAWAFLRSAEATVVEREDLRLAAAVAPATAELERAAARTGERARRLARSPAVQAALLTRDGERLARIARSRGGVAFSVAGRRYGDAPPRVAVTAVVTVLRRPARGEARRVVGRVAAFRPVDERLRARVTAAAALSGGRLLVRAAGTAAPAGGHDVLVGGREQRAVAGPPVAGVRVVALAPRSELDSALAERRREVILAVLATLLTVGFAAYAVPPALARDRLARRGLALIGDALAATHNARALLPVILHAAVEATGASGGVLLEDGREVVRVGADAHRGQPLRLTVDAAEGDGIELLLYPRAGGFGRDAREVGAWLAAQAGIALENARLHRIAREQAVTDPLTGLPNRRRFMDALAAELNRTDRFGSPLALVLLDLDDFKRINDRFGHDVGDTVLRHAAAVLAETAREVDVPARIGGEEFAVLLPETDGAGGEQLAERLRAALARPAVRTGEGEPVAVTASFGVAEHRLGGGSVDLLRAADRALYSAKLTGKNRVSSAAEEPGLAAPGAA